MEFHYVVMYDSDTKSWGVVDEVDGYMPDGTVWDNDTQEWFMPDIQGSPTAYLIDDRAYTMLRTLATLWPEVDHGES